MSNFTFLKTEWPEIHDAAANAEAHALTDPRTACFWARRTLEMAVHWLYANDRTLRMPYDDTLSARLHDAAFRNLIGQDRFTKARVIKDLGNDAVHSHRAIPATDSTQAVRELFHVLYWLARTYTRRGAASMPSVTFDPNVLSAGAKRDQALKMQTATRLLALEKELKERDQALTEKEQAQQEAAKTTAELDAEIKRLQAEVAEAKKRNSFVSDNHDYSEAQTRDFFIDLLLREAGWKLDKKEDREYPVEGMPDGKNGRVDYVLWGDDGLPLALVEAKRTKRDPRVGRQQATLYADCLETKFGRRPVIFYTNGYETWLFDDAHYPPRSVQGFYKKDELELLIQRRATRKLLREAPINPAIVERPYQTLAIRSVAERLEDDNMRRALVVMATGSGKTRTVIALCDLLQRCNWVKRVLFLADRISLVRQAANEFKKHLPGSTPINLREEKEDIDSRILLSTYPTMMGLIDESSDKIRRFGPGHFDLIVVDEAHRSIYQKYGAIFTYFDAMLVGLTATPRTDIDRNTYRLFELEDGVPTFAYELDEAVRDGWLVPLRAISVPIQFQRQGLHYDDLSEEQKEEWDSLEWSEDGVIPRDVDPEAVNKWLFNKDTVDQVLKHLFLNGIKVDGGDRLGKTIIFAKNHDHALFIEERFNALFPRLKGSFARVIDNYEPYAQNLLDDFSTADKAPHVAISVDMLDTGIDVPEVVNLVFFKMVRSKTKFFQMIGRGTRLRPDLFGPGQDKKEFFLFDYCGNLEFFGENPAGSEGNVPTPLSKKLFLRRLELLQAIREKPVTGGKRVREPGAAYRPVDAALADKLHAEVSAMSVDDFRVRPERKYVELYSERPVWDDLKPAEVDEIAAHLAGLPSETDPEDITAREFDLLMLNLQLAVLKDHLGVARYQERVVEIASLLEEKTSIPAVSLQIALIQEIQTADFWQDVTVAQLENVRRHMRDLVKFIDRRKRLIVYTDFPDQMGESVEMALPGLTTIDVTQYRKKVEQYFIDHREHPVVLKLRFNEPVTDADIAELQKVLDEIGGASGDSLFVRTFGDQPSLGAFVRGLVGLERAVAQKAFAKYLEAGTHTAAQIRFIEQIVEMLTARGTVQPAQLYEQPFVFIHQSGIDGLFPRAAADDIMAILVAINRNAGYDGGQGAHRHF